MQEDRDPEFALLIMDSFRDGVNVLDRGLGKLEAEWQALVGRIRALLEQLDRELGTASIWDTISEWWTEAVADAVRQVHKLMAAVGTKVDQILRAVREALSRSIPIASLFETATRRTVATDFH